MTVQNPGLITSVWMFVTCPSEDFKTLQCVRGFYVLATGYTQIFSKSLFSLCSSCLDLIWPIETFNSHTIRNASKQLLRLEVK